MDPFQWKLALDVLSGRPPVRTAFGLTLDNDRRELGQLLPTVGWDVDPGILEAGVRVPLRGRNLPAGPVWTLGYFITWDEPAW